MAEADATAEGEAEVKWWVASSLHEWQPFIELIVDCLSRWNRDTAANMRDVDNVQQLVDELVRALAPGCAHM